MPVDEILRQKFEMAVDQLADSMFRVAFRLTGNRDWASELVQESYLEAWRNLYSLKDVGKLRSWMFAILRNQYTKQLRKNVRWHALTDRATNNLTTEAGPAEETGDMIQNAISQLSEEQRLPLLLVSMEGLSVNEAAEVLDIPRGTVLSRLHRGRERLKLILNSELKMT